MKAKVIFMMCNMSFSDAHDLCNAFSAHSQACSEVVGHIQGLQQAVEVAGSPLVLYSSQTNLWPWLEVAGWHCLAKRDSECYYIHIFLSL